jgi:steroid delta-isomerase-like uncharacterized protein
MSADETKTIARRAFEEAWNGGDLAVLDELVAPGSVVHDPGTPGRAGGPEGEREAIQLYRAAFPDLHFTLEAVLAEDNTATVRWTARGTHRGDLPGIPATGRAAEVTGISVIRVAGGKIVEEWISWDALGLLQQLGVIPAPGQPA